MCDCHFQKKYLSKRVFPLNARVMTLFDTVGGNTINAQWIISATQSTFSRQHKIMRKITDLWRYEERNGRHTAMRYMIVIE